MKKEKKKKKKGNNQKHRKQKHGSESRKKINFLLCKSKIKRGEKKIRKFEFGKAYKGIGALEARC